MSLQPGRAARLADTHCHVDLYPDPAALVKRVEACGIYTIAVTNTPSVFPRMREMVEGCRYVRAAIGLHPELAVERAGELHLMWRLLPETRYVGEVGLDYVTDEPRSRRRQREVFSQIVERCDTSGDKILTVHSRRAADDVLEILGEKFRGKVILHWYSGSARVLDRAISRGFYISVNTAMTTSEKSRQLLRRVPKQHILCETDGPFVRTASGVPVDPFATSDVVSNLAREWDMPMEAARDTIYQNFATLLGG